MVKKIEIDELERNAFAVEVIRPLRLLKCWTHDNITIMTKAIEHVKLITQYPEDRLMDVIASHREFLRRNNRAEIPNTSPALYMSNLTWEAIYILCYYLFKDIKVWKEQVFPRMIELEPQQRVRDEMKQGEQLVNEFIARRKRLKEALASTPENAGSFGCDAPQAARITELEAHLKEKESEIEKLQARIAELEETDFFRFSFIRSYDQPVSRIKWSMQDIDKAKESATKTATCLKNLQRNDMLNGQERYGTLKKVKAMFEEMNEHYDLAWDYPALNKALNNLAKKKA